MAIGRWDLLVYHEFWQAHWSSYRSSICFARKAWFWLEFFSFFVLPGTPRSLSRVIDRSHDMGGAAAWALLCHLWLDPRQSDPTTTWVECSRISLCICNHTGFFMGNCLRGSGKPRGSPVSWHCLDTGVRGCWQSDSIGHSASSLQPPGSCLPLQGFFL